MILPAVRILMMSLHNNVQKIVYLGIFLALAMIFSYVESLIPVPFAVPGMKLGLPNVVIVLVLYCIGFWEALLVNVLRIFLTGILFTNVFSILFSLGGAVFSFVAMLLAKQLLKSHMIIVSTIGGVMHNVGQFVMALFLVQNFSVSYYLPILLVMGFVTGLCIGIASTEVYKRIYGRFFSRFHQEKRG